MVCGPFSVSFFDTHFGVNFDDQSKGKTTLDAKLVHFWSQSQ